MEDAAARKARLKAMREEAAAAAEGGGDQVAEPPAEVPAEEPVLKFRNYAVRDEKMIEFKKVWPVVLREARAAGLEPARRHALGSRWAKCRRLYTQNCVRACAFCTGRGSAGPRV